MISSFCLFKASNESDEEQEDSFLSPKEEMTVEQKETEDIEDQTKDFEDIDSNNLIHCNKMSTNQNTNDSNEKIMQPNQNTHAKKIIPTNQKTKDAEPTYQKQTPAISNMPTEILANQKGCTEDKISNQKASSNTTNQDGCNTDKELEDENLKLKIKECDHDLQKQSFTTEVITEVHDYKDMTIKTKFSNGDSVIPKKHLNRDTLASNKSKESITKLKEVKQEMFKKPRSLNLEDTNVTRVKEARMVLLKKPRSLNLEVTKEKDALTRVKEARTELLKKPRSLNMEVTLDKDALTRGKEAKADLLKKPRSLDLGKSDGVFQMPSNKQRNYKRHRFISQVSKACFIC